MKNTRRPSRRFESPFTRGGFEALPQEGKGYFFTAHGRFRGQFIGGTRAIGEVLPTTAVDFWYRSRFVVPPIDFRSVHGMDRFGIKLFGPPSREAVPTRWNLCSVPRTIARPDHKPILLLGGSGVSRMESTGADYAMEFGKCTGARQAGWTKTRDRLPQGDVKFIRAKSRLYDWNLGKFRKAGIPLDPNSGRIRRGKRIDYVIISGTGEQEIHISLRQVKQPASPGRSSLHGREGKVLRFPFPKTTEVQYSRVEKKRIPYYPTRRPTGGNFGGNRYGGSRFYIDEGTSGLHSRQSQIASRRPAHGSGASWNQIRHPSGNPWTFPFRSRNVDAPPAGKILAGSRGTVRSGIPHPTGEPWTFPFGVRSVDPPPATRQLAGSRGASRAWIPHPPGLPKTDPWLYRHARTFQAVSLIRDRIAGARRWSTSTRDIFDSTDYSKMPVYINLVWEPEVAIEIEYTPEVEIDLKEAS